MNDQFKYDVFISYRQQEPDRTWVRNVLSPRLADEGLKVFVDFRDFRLGAPVVTEMERGVEESRYTLAVITRRYFESGFTEFENVVSQHLGLEKSQLRLIILMREKCELSLRLRYRLWLEMKSDEELESNMPRLVEALRLPAGT